MMRIQGLLVFMSLFFVNSQSDFETNESDIVEAPVAAALVDGEDANIGNIICIICNLLNCCVAGAHPWHVGLV